MRNFSRIEQACPDSKTGTFNGKFCGMNRHGGVLRGCASGLLLHCDSRLHTAAAAIAVTFWAVAGFGPLRVRGFKVAPCCVSARLHTRPLSPQCGGPDIQASAASESSVGLDDGIPAAQPGAQSPERLKFSSDSTVVTVGPPAARRGAASERFF